MSSDNSRTLLKDFYVKLYEKNIFTMNNNGSADRLIFILSNKLLPVGQVREDILERICPIKQRPPGEPVHIGSLKADHTGRFFGRGGTGIREAVHGIPVGNITIDMRPISNSDMVEAHATFSCRPRHNTQVLEGLSQRVGYYEHTQPVPLSKYIFYTVCKSCLPLKQMFGTLLIIVLRIFLVINNIIK